MNHTNATRDFHVVSLEEASRVNLQERMDTKFVFPATQIPELFGALQPYYDLLRIDGHVDQEYHSQYFDLADMGLYLQHHNGRRNRVKLRTRSYVCSGLKYFEIKKKANTGKTIKMRIPIETQAQPAEYPLSRLMLDSTGILPGNIFPSLEVNFTRFTFIDKEFHDRATVDVELRVASEGETFTFQGIAIAEVKQDRLNGSSHFIQALKRQGINPMSFSKYCMGIASTHQNIRKNRFLQKQRVLDKMMNDNAG